MSTQRHIQSHDFTNFHEHTPRKSRSLTHPSGFEDTKAYMRGLDMPVSSDGLDPKKELWIGMYFIPRGKQPANPSKMNYVMEAEIAREAYPYDFQILFIGAAGRPQYMGRSTGLNVASKPDHQFRPSRMNIHIDVKNIIRDITFG